MKKVNLAETWEIEEQLRFPNLIKQDSGIMIDVGYIDRKSDDYKNKDMTLEINMGCIELNWRPRTFCRFLRFVRYLKFKTDSYH